MSDDLIEVNFADLRRFREEIYPTISSKAELVKFIYWLVDDLKENPQNWDNSTLESFLEAMAGWIHDMDGYYMNGGQPIPETPSWDTIVDILLSARVYE